MRSAFAAACGACAAFLCWGESAADAADLSRALPTKAPPAAISTADDWTGFYAGGHFGYAWGNSNWTTPGISASFVMFPLSEEPSLGTARMRPCV